jgi:hypothetical protein
MSPKHRHLADLSTDEIETVLLQANKLSGLMARLGIDNRPEWYAVNRIFRDLLAESDRRRKAVAQ